jgi:putative protein-disulfide isomerase
MPVEIRFYSDPACPWSWGSEPALRHLIWEFEGELEFTWVMGGLARRYGSAYRDSEGRIGEGPDCFADLIAHWLNVAAATGMPCDPRIWAENPLESTYPACQAVKAASEQGWEAGYRYLRALREGIMFGRRKLDHLEALLAEAGPAGLDRERFEIDLRSNAITEAFATDLDEVREPPDDAFAAGAISRTEGHERVSFPSVVIVAADGSRLGLWGSGPYVRLRDAVLEAGATARNPRPLEVLEAVDRFGRVATRELEELCGLPRPVLEAELWALARDWKLRAVPALTGTIWELAT